MPDIPNVGSLRGYLWTMFPEARPGILEEEAWVRDSGLGREDGFDTTKLFVGVYDYVSEVFWRRVFEPALESNNEELTMRCFRAMEDLLSRPEELIWEAASIRVVSLLPEWPQTRVLAGPILRRELAEETATIHGNPLSTEDETSE